jgi:hypothetical protein
VCDRATADAFFTGHCHCRDCQYASGGAYAPVALVAKAALESHGETRAFTVAADSRAQVTRRFCPTCSTPLFSEVSANPDVMVVKAGTLDDPFLLAPSMHIWTASAVPWAETSGTLPSVAGTPR